MLAMGIRLQGLCMCVLLALCGCAAQPVSSTRGDVTLTPVEPPDTPRHVRASDETFEIGELLPDSRRNPEYPAALLARTLPEVVLCVEVSIDTAGRVTQTTPLLAPPRCASQPADIETALKTSVDAAVLQWEFLPSYVCKRAFGIEDDGYCADDDPTRIAVPMLRGYRFVFTQTADGASVRGEETAGD
jgi:hypothetical protein